MERKLIELIGDFMLRRPLTSMFIFFVAAISLACIVLVIADTFSSDEQKQIEFVNACNQTGKIAALKYVEVKTGKFNEFKPVVECK